MSCSLSSLLFSSLLFSSLLFPSLLFSERPSQARPTLSKSLTTPFPLRRDAAKASARRRNSSKEFVVGPKQVLRSKRSIEAMEQYFKRTPEGYYRGMWWVWGDGLTSVCDSRVDLDDGLIDRSCLCVFLSLSISPSFSLSVSLPTPFPHTSLLRVTSKMVMKKWSARFWVLKADRINLYRDKWQFESGVQAPDYIPLHELSAVGPVYGWEDETGLMADQPQSCYQFKIFENKMSDFAEHQIQVGPHRQIEIERADRLWCAIWN